MKNVLLGCFLALAPLSASFALSIDDIAGTYRVSFDYDGYPIHMADMTIQADYRAEFSFNSQSMTRCEGDVELLENSTLELKEMSCSGGMSAVSLSIDLNGVTDFAGFSAVVFSSFFAGGSQVLNFERM